MGYKNGKFLPFLKSLGSYMWVFTVPWTAFRTFGFKCFVVLSYPAKGLDIGYLYNTENLANF